MAIHTLAQWDHRARVERSEVGQPAPKDRVDLLCEVFQRQSGASLQPPGHCLAADIGQLPRIHSRHAACVDLLPFPVEGLPGSKRIPAELSLIHISEPTRLGMISYAVFCLKKKKKK